MLEIYTISISLMLPSYSLASVAAVSGDCRCGLAQRAAKIVGGQTTEVNEYPWQAELVDMVRLLPDNTE